MLKPILGALLAIAITTTMDATGLSVFSALPLLPLAGLFWYLQKLSRAEMGVVWGTRRYYGAAVLYPLVVLGAATLIAVLAGSIDTSETNWNHFYLNLFAGGATTILVAFLTEEGFFRGWLWASLRRAGVRETRTLVWTSAAFALWHLSAISLDTGFDLPAAQIPVYMVNALLLGLIWGILRLISGSIVVASVSHGIWNGIAYALFAFGAKVGALGVTQASVYGPEVGFVGLVLNAAFAAGLWRWFKRREGA